MLPYSLLNGHFPIAAAVQALSHIRLFATPWTAANQASLSTISRSLLKFMSIESVTPSNHLILCCPLLLLPPIFPSIRVFSNESALRLRWPKDWSFSCSFSISLSSGFSQLFPFRMDWLHFLAVQESSPTPQFYSLEKHLFFGAKPSLCSNSHSHTWPLEEP